MRRLLAASALAPEGWPRDVALDVDAAGTTCAATALLAWKPVE